MDAFDRAKSRSTLSDVVEDDSEAVDNQFIDEEAGTRFESTAATADYSAALSV